jgi:hypothetical protein
MQNIRMLWRRDDLWVLEASPSNDIEDRRLGVGRGGIVECFYPRLQL